LPIHDISIQDLDVMLAIDRAGIVGADGETHNGTFDISFMRCIPNIVIFMPSDEAECRNMLHTAFHHKGLTAVRYPRGAGVGAIEAKDMKRLAIGKGRVIRESDKKKVALLSFGTILNESLKAGESLDATVIDMRFAKPLDEDLIQEIGNSHDLLVTIEENVVMGGAGSAVNEFAQQAKINVKILNLGLPDHYIHHGTQSSLLSQVGLDTSGIKQSIQDYLKK